MKSIFLTGWFLVFGIEAIGQSTINAFLSAPISDIEYKRAQASSAFAEQHKFRSPWLREFDFRLRTDDSRLDVEEYRLRLGLLNPWEINANQGYRALIREKSAVDLLRAENDVLQRRFELLLEHFFLTRKAALIHSQQKLLASQWTFYINSPGDVSELIELKKSATTLKLDSMEAQQNKDWLSEKIKAESGVDLHWQGFDLVNPDRIMTLVESIDPSDDNLFEEEIRSELALEEQLLRVERAEAFSNIGFIQAEYDSEQGNETSEHMGFQLGMQLPLFNTDRPDFERSQMDAVSENVDAAYAGEEYAKRIGAFKSRILMTYGQYLLIDSEQSNIDDLEKLIENSDVDLEAYLELAEYKFFLENRKHALRATLTSQYLSMLGFAGAFSQRPLTNYLSAALENFNWQE